MRDEWNDRHAGATNGDVSGSEVESRSDRDRREGDRTGHGARGNGSIRPHAVGKSPEDGEHQRFNAPLRGIRSYRNGSSRSHTLITGGAGFIGTNLADKLLDSGRRVCIFDNLARPGVERNLEWLCQSHPHRVEVQLKDIRDPEAVREAVRRADQVFHFAAQVAVTTSTQRPMEDFEINLRGTLNILEAIRSLDDPPPLLFTSTNKVYGSLEDVPVHLEGAAYHPTDVRYSRGIGTDRRLDFQSPYGCSKGAADAYVLDYCRMYNLPTVVFRMSCIYGPHQFGTEDQGWIAHFLMRALRGEPITIYGDGRQVRDVLYVDDLVRSMVMALNEIEHVRGRAYNVGGGAGRAVSLLQVLNIVEGLHGSLPEVVFSDWRPSDQKYYVSDTSELEQATGWSPTVSVEEGLARLYDWMLIERPSLPLEAAQ